MDFFQVIPLAAVHSSVDCARNDPTIASASLFRFSVGMSSRSSSQSLIISVVETLNNTHPMEPCTRQDPLLLETTSAPLTLCGCWICAFCVDCTWREYSRYLTTTHETFKILSFLDRYWQDNKSVRWLTTRIVSMKSLFRHYAHEWNQTVCTDWLALSQTVTKKEVLRTVPMTGLTHHSQQTRQVAWMTNKMYSVTPLLHHWLWTATHSKQRSTARPHRQECNARGTRNGKWQQRSVVRTAGCKRGNHISRTYVCPAQLSFRSVPPRNARTHSFPSRSHVACEVRGISGWQTSGLLLSRTSAWPSPKTSTSFRQQQR